MTNNQININVIQYSKIFFYIYIFCIYQMGSWHFKCFPTVWHILNYFTIKTIIIRVLYI